MFYCSSPQEESARIAYSDADIAHALSALQRRHRVDADDLARVAEASSPARELAYAWNAATDRLDWESHAQQVLGLRSIEQISTRESFRALIAFEPAEQRLPWLGDRPITVPSNGVPYRARYKFMTEAGDGIWVEDEGRWWTGPDGRPTRAVGILRTINAPDTSAGQLRHRNDHDELTGQLVRSRLIEALDAAVKKSRSREITTRHHAFLMIAVNHLSATNEMFGFQFGDEVLSAVGKLIRSNVRSGDIVGRYASNKFGVILNDCSAETMRMIANRLIKSVRGASIGITDREVAATISVGGVLIPSQADCIQKAIDCAMLALSHARLNPSEGFYAFASGTHRQSDRSRNLTIAREVMAALNDNRMRLALQPIVSARTGQPVFHECLLRIVQHDGTTVPASQFIGVAEQLGLAHVLDRRALELAIDLLKRDPSLHLALNVSAMTCGDREWLDTLRSLAGTRCVAERLTIEITETSALQDVDQSALFVDTVKELGCRVAIDDFGAGYTSFANLKRLPVDMVKIDGAFVKDMSRNSSDRVFVKAMIDLSRHFEMETVAEWVGDDQTIEMLTEAGIDYLQGFHVGEPVLMEPPMLLRQSA